MIIFYRGILLIYVAGRVSTIRTLNMQPWPTGRTIIYCNINHTDHILMHRYVLTIVLRYMCWFQQPLSYLTSTFKSIYNSEKMKYRNVKTKKKNKLHHLTSSNPDDVNDQLQVYLSLPLSPSLSLFFSFSFSLSLSLAD